MSGILKSIGKAVKKVFKAIGKIVKKILPIIIIAAIVVAAVYTGGAALGAMGAAGGATAGTAGVATAGVATGGAAAAAPALLGPTAGLNAAGATTTAAAPALLGPTAGLNAAPAAAPALLGPTAGLNAPLSAAQGGMIQPATMNAPASAVPQITTQQMAVNTTGATQQSAQAFNQAASVNGSWTMPAKGASSPAANSTGGIWNTAKNAGSGLMNFADKHPFVAGTMLQTVGAFLKSPPPDPNEPPKQFFGVTPGGSIYDPGTHGMVDYMNSPKASPEWKQAAGVTQTPTAPAFQITDTPKTPLGTDVNTGEGFQIQPVQPAANTINLAQGLLGGVKITGA